MDAEGCCEVLRLTRDSSRCVHGGSWRGVRGGSLSDAVVNSRSVWILDGCSGFWI
jgi:hypothetical protein|uniref:Uncharacterized protein n=1 Tax=Arabidopsis thaliana TaxID=3702 RepID=Q8GWS1_ARATH|nr:unknown protein [Arabidopsis thaliana]